METDDLRGLVAIAAHGSVKAAADSLNVTRSQLRRSLDRLERRFGAPVTHRGASGVSLNSAGEHLLERAQSLIDAATELENEVRSRAAQPVGAVRVIAPVGIPAVMRAAAFGMLRMMQPGLRLHASESEDPLAHRNEPFDLMLHFGPGPSQGDWFSRVLMRQPTGLFAAPSYLEQRGTPEAAEDLAEHDLLSWSVPGVPSDLWPLCAGGTISVNPWLRVGHGPTLRLAVGNGLGIGHLPSALPPPPGAGPVVPVLPGVVGGTVELRALSRHASRKDPRLATIFANIDRLAASVGD